MSLLTIGKSTMLGAAFLAGVAILACRYPPGPQIAALPPANGPPANPAPAPEPTLQYRGKVDHAGGVKARDTDDDRSDSILRGQIGNNEFTGNLEHNYCHNTLTMQAEAVAAGFPVR